MDRADLLGAEEVAEVGREAGEATAVAGDDEEDEPREEPDARDLWHHEEGDDLDGEERRVGRRPADVIRQRGPHDAAAAVEDPDVAGDERRGRRARTGDLLEHRRGEREQHDPRGDVDEDDEPDHPEPRRGARLLRGEVADTVERALRFLLVLRGVLYPLGEPALRRFGEIARAGGHQDEVENAERVERRRDADGLDEVVPEWTGQQRPGTEAHHREARRHPAAVGEPLDERSDRRDVAESEPHPADDPERGEEQREAPELDAEPRSDHPEAVQHRRRQPG